MGRELYRTEPTFRDGLIAARTLLNLGLDLRSLIYPSESETEVAAQKLQQTNITQPALFVIEYALAQLWMAWGISPQAMLGHSVGICLLPSGVISRRRAGFGCHAWATDAATTNWLHACRFTARGRG